MFSGGKDSQCTLYLMKPYWDRLTVLWVNTGAAYPETLAVMERVRAEVPHFVELHTKQPEGIEQHGYPVDVLPLRYSATGHMFEPGPRILLQSYVDCCTRHIWHPAHEYCRQHGVTTIIRGQRNAERMTGPIRSGHVENGITYIYPIESWSDEDVFDFLAMNDIEIPAHYEMTETSLDCWSCTAYLHEIGVHRWLAAKHPEKHAVVQERLQQINAAGEAELTYIHEVLKL